MENAIEQKSFMFAVKIVQTARELRSRGKEHELTRQLLRSGTSIGANVSEAQHAQSKSDFIAKMSIALKEASETRYWLRLIKETDPAFSCESLFSEADELIRLLCSIIKTAKH